MGTCLLTSQEKRRQRRQQVRDGTKGLSISMAKALSNLALAEALVNTGAQDKTEVNWSSLSLQHPRALMTWKNLTGGRRNQPPNSNRSSSSSSSTLGLQEVSGDGSWVVAWVVNHGSW